METQPAPIEEHLAGGSSSSEVESSKGPEPPAPSGDLAFLGGGSMELNKGCLDLGPDAHEQGPQNGEFNQECVVPHPIEVLVDSEDKDGRGSEQSTLPVIYVGNVKLQTGLVDDIAGAFLQSSRKTLHFVPPTRQNGEIIIRPTKEVVDSGSKKWQHYCSGLSSGTAAIFSSAGIICPCELEGLTTCFCYF
ncbi:UNVERIFIED_CONTAM: hypothetical protein Sradi_6928400 [Sesamum radiatum]|uniref:Uncharacterized protein n=1 Tax=Sesamum radiatum TaxID=300843 RepID=A0AAW2JG49_SESRA